jgi:glycerol kinase
MPRYLLAIDQGTTSTRCMAVAATGPLAIAHQEHRQIFPQPGWVEHDPLEIWDAACRTMTQVLSSADIAPADVAAIGITNQRETTVVWDRASGKPVYNAIVWQDTRTRELCDALAIDGGVDRFRDRTGLPLATYFSGPKIRWILDNVPGARADAQAGRLACGTIDSWLAWNLTGGPAGGNHITDVTNASRTMLMNLATLDWDDALLEAMQIPRRLLPRIVPSVDAAGWGSADHGAGPGLPTGLAAPLCAILGDQQAALVGQCCFAPGESKNTYGTGCFLLMNTGPTPVPSTRGLLTTVAYQVAGKPAVYALEGSVAVTGALVQWFRDNLGLIPSAPAIEALAATVTDNGGVYIVPAFSGLFAPYWRSDARGVIAGLTAHCNKGHLARAALEAAAFQTRDLLDAMAADSGVPLRELRVDGGMTANELLMQFQADILDRPVTRSHVRETTALGAAYGAGLAIGIWSGTDELRAAWRADRSWQPNMLPDRRSQLIHGWQKAVQRSFGWLD